MVTKVDHVEVQHLLKEGVQLLEVLPEEEFSTEHLPDATNLPLKDLSAGTVEILDRARPVIVYCKAAWMANALPTEGSGAATPRIGDHVKFAPLCGLGDPVEEVRNRVGLEGWDMAEFSNTRKKNLRKSRLNSC